MEEQFLRQADIIPRDRLCDYTITVIGTGAIGRQVALQLTAIGASKIQLIDFDTVEIHNLATQGFFVSDISKPKVEAIRDLCRQMSAETIVEAINERFRRSMEIGSCVFCCVDSIGIREHIWNAVKDKVNFFCDGRMSSESMRIITACCPESKEYYPKTLFAQAEAFTGACTAKSTIYCANIAAGFMLSRFTKYLRNIPVDADIQINLLADEISINEN